MARNKQQQRIDGPTLRPTQGLTDNFVAAHSPNQINMEGAAAADWTEGFKDLLVQGEKAVSAHRKAEDKALYEAGEAVWADVSAGETLDKAVAKYTASGTTPRGLRKKLREWTEGGKMSKSANPYFVRAFEEGKNKQTATLFETTLAADMQELVAAGMSVAGPGRHKEMLEAIQGKISGYMTDDMFKDQSGYGAGHLKGLLLEKGNRMAGLALARAEDEMTTLAVESHAQTFVDDVDRKLAAQSALSVLTGGRVTVDADNTFNDLGQALSGLHDNIRDMVPPEQANKVVEDAMVFSMNRIADSAMDDTSKIEHIQKMADKSTSVRTNGGQGPAVFGLAGSSRVISKGQSLVHNIERASSYKNTATSKGEEYVASIVHLNPWMTKRPEDRSQAEQEERLTFIQDAYATKDGAAYGRGVLRMLGEFERGATKSKAMTPEESNLQTAYKTDPVGTATNAGAPIGYSDPAMLFTWARGLTDNPELQGAMVQGTLSATKVFRDQASKISGNWDRIIDSTVKTGYATSMADLDPNAGPLPEVTQEVDRLRNDAVLLKDRDSILEALRFGDTTPEDAYAELTDMVREAYARDADTLATLNKVTDAEVKASADIRASAKEAVDKPRDVLVGDGDKVVFRKPDSFLDFSNDDPVMKMVDAMSPNQSESVTTWLWKGPMDKSLGEFSKTAHDQMMAFENVPGLAQVERYLAGVPKATGDSTGGIMARAIRTAEFIDAEVAQHILESNPHDSDFMSLGDDFYDDIEIEFAREAMRTRGVIASGIAGTAEFVLGKDKATLAMRKELANHGTSREFVSSYYGLSKLLRPDADGNAVVLTGPGGIPNWSVISMPKEIDEEELLSPDLFGPDVSPIIAKGAYMQQRKQLEDSSNWLLFTGDPDVQRVVDDIGNRVAGRVLLERHWATTQRVYEKFYGPYNHADEGARTVISNIWQHLAESETSRKVEL